jgi:alkylation response protein AidB-like acyl-CoA dehydrogenase
VAVAQLFLAAVLAGIAKNALTDAVAFTTERARPIVHSVAKRSADDPYVQHAVGEISARAFAAEAALRSGELVFDVGGASATLREHNLDRHWRNARTVANHNPRAYKAGVVGAYRLTGAEPPTSGLF